MILIIDVIIQRDKLERKFASWILHLFYCTEAEHQHQNVARSDPRLQKKVKSLKNQKKRMDRATENFSKIPNVEEASEFRFDSSIHIHRHKKILELSLETLEKENKQLSQI